MNEKIPSYFLLEDRRTRKVFRENLARKVLLKTYNRAKDIYGSHCVATYKRHKYTMQEKGSVYVFTIPVPVR